MTIENIADHQAFTCECGSVHFNLLKSGSIECAGCQRRFGRWSCNGVAIATVVNNNQPKKQSDNSNIR